MRPATPLEIATAIDADYDNVRRLMVRMKDAGQLEREKRGWYSLPRVRGLIGPNVSNEETTETNGTKESDETNETDETAIYKKEEDRPW
jgi:hypothetical protein